MLTKANVRGENVETMGTDSGMANEMGEAFFAVRLRDCAVQLCI
jgi:hypothetical protein